MVILKTFRYFLRLLLPFALTIFLILNIYVEMTNHFDYSRFDETFIRSNLLAEQERQWVRRNFAQFATRNYDEPLQERSEKISLIIERFINYVDTIHADLDKTVSNNTQWRFWDEKNSYFGNKMPQATQIKVKIAETHQQLIDVLKSISPLVSSKGGKPDEEIKQMKENLLLKIDENEGITNRKRSWEALTFGDLSIAACHTMLNKIQNDALTDEIRMRSYLSSKIGGCCCFDKNNIVSEPQKNYVLDGEKFQTKISLMDLNEMFAKTLHSNPKPPNSIIDCEHIVLIRI